MGLSHTKDTDFGVDAKYFNIDRLSVRPNESTVQVLIHGFVNKGKYMQGALPIFVRTFLWTYEELELVLGQPIVDITQEDIYTFLKATPDFTGATDD